MLKNSLIRELEEILGDCEIRYPDVNLVVNHIGLLERHLNETHAGEEAKLYHLGSFSCRFPEEDAEYLSWDDLALDYDRIKSGALRGVSLFMEKLSQKPDVVFVRSSPTLLTTGRLEDDAILAKMRCRLSAFSNNPFDS